MPPSTRATPVPEPAPDPPPNASVLAFDPRAVEMMLPKPKLTDLSPLTVNDFLVKFAAHDVYVRSSLGVNQATLQLCIAPEVLKELDDLEVDVSNRTILWKKLQEISNQDAGSRKLHVIQMAEQLQWINQGNIPASARDYVRRAELLKKNLIFDDYSAKRFVKALVSGLPSPFLRGGVKETIESRQWKSFAFFKESLLQLASQLAEFQFPDDDQLSTEVIIESSKKPEVQHQYKSKPQSSNLYAPKMKTEIKQEPYNSPAKSKSCFACGNTGHFVKDCPKLTGLAARHEPVRKVQAELSKPNEESQLSEEERHELSDLFMRICSTEEANTVVASFPETSTVNLCGTGNSSEADFSDEPRAVLAHGLELEFPDAIERVPSPTFEQLPDSSEFDLLGLRDIEVNEDKSMAAQQSCSILDELIEELSWNNELEIDDLGSDYTFEDEDSNGPTSFRDDRELELYLQTLRGQRQFNENIDIGSDKENVDPDSLERRKLDALVEDHLNFRYATESSLARRVLFQSDSELDNYINSPEGRVQFENDAPTAVDNFGPRLIFDTDEDLNEYLETPEAQVYFPTLAVEDVEIDSLSENIPTPESVSCLAKRSCGVLKTTAELEDNVDDAFPSLMPFKSDELLESEIKDFPRLIEVGYGENTASDNIDEVANLDEIKTVIDSKLTRYLQSGVIDVSQRSQLKSVLYNHLDAFGLRKSGIRLSDLEPMSVKLKPNAEPWHAKERKMSSEMLEAMRKKVRDLEELGLLVKDENPFFSSCAMMVPKADRSSYRMVVDLMEVNTKVELNSGSLPNLEMQMSWVPASSKWFCGYDFLSGFDLLRVREEDTKYFGVLTPFGVYRMVGAPQGFVNTPVNFQSRMIDCVLGGVSEGGLFARKKGGFLQWLDDSFGYSDTFSEMLYITDRFLSNVEKYKLRLNVEKCDFIGKSISWCGRVFSDQG